MRVSFVIPTLDQARFIRQAIDSCLAQGLPDAEILVVDGLSRDGTQEILAGYGERISWTSEQDAGQADAVNRGITRATGEIIAWLNSDDFYPDANAVREVLRAFDADPRVDVVYGDTTIVAVDGHPIRRHRSRTLRSPVDLLVQPTAPAMQPAIFFRRALFQAVGGLRRDLHYAMDYDLWLRLFPRARALHRIPTPLACARFHADAKSIAGMRRQIEELRALKRLHLPAFRLGPVDRARLALGTASLYAYWMAVKLGLRGVG